MTRSRRLILSALLLLAIAGAAGAAMTHRPDLRAWWQRMHLPHRGDVLLDLRGHDFDH